MTPILLLFPSDTISLSFLLFEKFLQCFLTSTDFFFFIFLFSKLLLGHWIFSLVMSSAFFMYGVSPVQPCLRPLRTCFLSVWIALPSRTCMAGSLNSFRSLLPVIIYLKLLYSLLPPLLQHNLVLFFVFSFSYSRYYSSSDTLYTLLFVYRLPPYWNINCMKANIFFLFCLP